MQLPRVVVIGAGSVTPFGIGKKKFVEGMRSGRSAVRRIQNFEIDEAVERYGIGVQVAAEIPIEEYDPTDHFTKGQIEFHYSRATQLVVVATRDALNSAEIDLGTLVQKEQIPVSVMVGNSFGDLVRMDETMRAFYEGEGIKGVGKLDAGRVLGNLSGANIAKELKLDQGTNPASYVHRIDTACASGTSAIARAAQDIQYHGFPLAIASGVEAGISRWGVALFEIYGALTDEVDDPELASRPFDRDRNGFAPGEGGGTLILANKEWAEAHGYTPLAEIVGYGESIDGNPRMKAPQPDFNGQARAMMQASERARTLGIHPQNINYFAAHATSTDRGDPEELEAIIKAFGPGARFVPLSSLKSQIGHILGGAGAVESVGLVYMIQDKFIAPSTNLIVPGENCEWNHVGQAAMDYEIAVAQKNNMGFGGQNAVVQIADSDFVDNN